MLSPILISGYGRSGTTAIMNLLATDPQVAFDRAYPFENRYLSYYAKLASILEQRRPNEQFTSDVLYPYEESIFGPRPWGGHHSGTAAEWLRIFWTSFSQHVSTTDPRALFYAEKAPVWLPAMARQVVPCSTVYLFRDPRDVYLSSNAFMKKRNYYGFHRSPTDSDLDHARNMGPEILSYFESFRWDRQPADCFCLRYEDLITYPDEFLAWLRKKDIEPDLSRSFEYIDSHRTSSDPPSSVERWRKEEVPSQVNDFFERHLGREMKALGYPVESARFCPSVDFHSGAPVPQLSNPTHGDVELEEDAMTIHITGNDFGLLLPFESIRATDVREVWVCAAGYVGDHFSVYWRDMSANFSEERRLHVDYVPGLHWRVIRFQLSQHPLWHGNIEQIRVDLFNGRAERTEGMGHVRWVRLVC